MILCVRNGVDESKESRDWLNNLDSIDDFLSDAIQVRMKISSQDYIMFNQIRIFIFTDSRIYSCCRPYSCCSVCMRHSVRFLSNLP